MGEAKRRKAAAAPSPDSGLELLSPEEGVELSQFDRSRLYFPVESFCECFHLSPEQFRREAAAGRLQVLGMRRRHDAWSDLVIPYQSALEWIARYRIMH